ncbi:ROK family transcriptional regulator [Streptomyces prunicolor]|uniref:ROK family transcriptional regulator n=1 Tax=Streptomyces prunicolor TaxID=67348 RepID=A0ABU4FKF2_9ACTN|nr:ROK family transcriptional regulator [Streptomyces prunicolor]MDV7220500.1 ROK family transcriptional regulator [Streptomyces prunicolor]
MPASPSTARAINDRLALRLLQQEGPLTAGQLKQLTGLSRPTVADLVERLTASGLIEMVGESGEQRRGPNARLYGIVADRAYLAALDVRLEGVSVLVSDLVGRVLAEASVPIDDDSGTGPAVEQAVALVERAAKEAGAEHLHTVCVGAPGLIDPTTGELRDTSGLPAWHRRLVAALHERLPDTRIVVENETNLAALAEQRDGAAHDRDTFVLLWLGMGIGAAVVLDGTLRRGASGGAGELGFLPVPGTRGLPSATDCEGGFHSLAGAGAVLELARECGVLGVEGAEGSSAAEVVRWAVAGVGGSEPGARGDAGAGGGADAAATPDGASAPDYARAARFLDTLADRLALGVASVVALLDPGCVVLGGEVGQAGGDELAVRVAERITRMSPLPAEVRPSALGGAAVLRGALLTAQDGAQGELFG